MSHEISSSLRRVKDGIVLLMSSAEKPKNYIEHPTKAVEDPRFSHMMALALDPSSGYKSGVIRCITSREGDVELKGYIDRSELFTVSFSVIIQ